MNVKELTLWYTFTDVNVKNYFGCKLPTTIQTNVSVSEIETDSTLLGWSRIDVKAYLNERVETEAIMHCILSCPEIHQLICFQHVQIFHAKRRFSLPLKKIWSKAPTVKAHKTNQPVLIYFEQSFSLKISLCLWQYMLQKIFLWRT